MEVDKSVRKTTPAHVNVVTMEEWNCKFPSLFECGASYEKSEFQKKMVVCHKEVDWIVPVEDIPLFTTGITYDVMEVS